MTAPTPLIAGNWKMNGLRAALEEAKRVADGATGAKARVALCPPATLIAQMAWALKDGTVLIGGQDAHAEPSGAFTGDISAPMLKDAGASLVILGHSERRTLHGETDALVAAKTRAALAAGLEPIICVGETLAEREAGQALAVVSGQVGASLPDELAGAAFAVAYEPVWAIGTGLTPTLAEIEEAHVAIRDLLAESLDESGLAAPILYGGSVKPANAAEILAISEVGGALVGGASLLAADFMAIVSAA